MPVGGIPSWSFLVRASVYRDCKPHCGTLRARLLAQQTSRTPLRMLENPSQRSRGDNHDRQSEVRVPSKELLRASGQVQSLSRALKLLNALSYHPQGLSLSEVA